MPRISFRQSDVQRALKAALGLGLTVVGYEIGPDGNIIVRTAEAANDTADAALAAWERTNGTRRP